MFENLIPFDSVIEAYDDARKHKSRTDSCTKFRINLLSELRALHKDLVDGTYSIGTSTCFIVTRPKPREVFAAQFRDRVVQHYVVIRLLPIFEQIFIKNSFSSREGKGTLYGVNQLHESMKNNPDMYVAKMDIHGFFMHINKKKLLNKLLNLIDEYYIADDKPVVKWLVTLILTHRPELDCIRKSPISKWKLIEPSKSLFHTPEGFGLEIGNITSQLFANFYLLDLDLMTVDALEDNYGRYVDDFYGVGPLELLLELRKKADALLEDLDLELHKDKFYIQPVSHKCPFIGSTVGKDRIYVNNRTIYNAVMEIKKFNGIINRHEPSDDNIRRVFQSLNSYLGYMTHSRSFNIRKSLIESLDEKWLKYFHQSDNYNKVIMADEYKGLLRSVT